MAKNMAIRRLEAASQLFVLLLCLAPLPAASSGSADRLKQAHRLYQTGRYHEAADKYADAIRDPKLAFDANMGLAAVYMATGRYADAENACQAALTTTPQHPDALTLLGDIHRIRGRYDEARAQFWAVVNRHPDHLDARLNLALMQLEWGEKKKAQQNLQYFVEYYQSSLDISARELTLIARACVHLNRVRDANTLFHEATDLDPQYWQAYVHWGNLFLDKYNTADAQSTFQDALKVNPNSAAAHVGLARCYREKSFDKAAEAANAALAVNPGLVAAHDFLAELDIATGDFGAALVKLDRALAINPKALTSKTLRAVCFHLQNKQEHFRTEEQEILRINPKYADLYFQLAEVQAKRYLFQESVDFYRKALALNPDHIRARAGYGTSLSRLGEEEAAKEALERAFARDPYNKHVGNLLTLFDELPGYKSHRVGDVVVRIHERDDPVLSQYAVDLAQRCFKELRQRYDFDTTRPVVLEIFPEHDDFAVRCFGLPGAQAFLGICFGNVVAMDSPRARSKGDFVWGETMWHELVHVTHLTMTANRIPRWLAEGIAVYETSRANPHWRMNLDLPFIMAFQNDRLLPLKELDSGFNRPTSPGQVSLSYFQASKIVEFIEDEYGHAKLLAMFPKFKNGQTSTEVIEAVFGKDVEQFDREFHDFVVAHYRLSHIDLRRPGGDKPDHGSHLESHLAQELSEHGNNPLLHYRFGMYYKAEGAFDKAIPYLLKAKELFPQFAEKDNPYAALAEIYEAQGEPQKAIRELVQLTALNGKDVGTLQKLASLSLQEQDDVTAIAALQKVLYITPFESELHLKLAQAYMAANRADDAIAELEINLLTRPRDLAGAHCELASALLHAGRKAEAKQAVLKALEIAPNYERAQEILLATIE